MVLVEAMAAGLPVVAAASGAIPEVLRGQAPTFAPGDWTELARLLAVRAAGSPARRARVDYDRGVMEHVLRSRLRGAARGCVRARARLTTIVSLMLAPAHRRDFGWRSSTAAGVLRLRPAVAQITQGEGELIERCSGRRKRVVQIGVAEGGSAWHARRAMDPSGELCLIDTYPQGARPQPVEHHRAATRGQRARRPGRVDQGALG